MNKKEAIARVEDHMSVHGITPHGRHMHLYDALQMLMSIAHDSPVTELDTFQYLPLSASVQLISHARHLPLNTFSSLEDRARRQVKQVIWNALDHNNALEVTIDPECMRATATLLVGIRR